MRFWQILKDYGPIAISIATIFITVGVYKKTVDDLEDRVAQLEAQPRVMQAATDPRLEECTRLARDAYGDGSRAEMDDRTDLLMLRLGCDQQMAGSVEP